MNKKCEFEESCEKHTWLCFNEYVEVCSTRFALKLLKRGEKGRKTDIII